MRQRCSRRAPTLRPRVIASPVRHAGRLHRWLRRLLVLGLAGALASLIGAGTFLYTYAGELPSLSHLSAQSLPQTTRIYARDGVTLLEERYQQRRTVVPLTNIAWDLRHATIAIEDRDFYNHGAVSPIRMVAAGLYDVLHRSAAQGGSTITQQLVKNYLLGASADSRSLDRKARELVLAVELEREYSKDQILEMYLNTIFYGNQAFGIEAASQTYFGVPAARLDLAQASFLAGLPQRPTFFNPFLAQGYSEAHARQRDVLNAMVRDGYITPAAAERAYAENLQARRHRGAASRRRPPLVDRPPLRRLRLERARAALRSELPALRRSQDRDHPRPAHPGARGAGGAKRRRALRQKQWRQQRRHAGDGPAHGRGAGDGRECGLLQRRHRRGRSTTLSHPGSRVPPSSPIPT